MARIVILGAGVMGSAMSVPADARGHDIRLVGTHLDTQIVEAIMATRVHPTLGMTLPDSVKAYQWTEFGAILDEGADMIIIGVSSAGVEWAIDRLVVALSTPVPILMVTKGLAIEDATLSSLPAHISNALEERLGFAVPIVAVAGPAIAAEQAAKRNTSVVFTGTDGDAIDHAMAMMRTPFYHTRCSTDVTGVEFCAAFKNFFALGIGTAGGRFEASAPVENGSKMHNVAASLFTQALTEMRLLVTTHGGDAGTVGGLAGSGDLYVTCMAGRNTKMGRLLGTGLTYSQAKSEHMPDDTVEGADLALSVGPALGHMFSTGQLDRDAMPMTTAIIDAICGDRAFAADWTRFHAA